MCSVKKNQNKKMENLKNVNVDICFMDKFKKRDSVLKIFETQGAAESVIFVEERMSADILASFLSECDYKSTSIHGARKRQQRIHALFEYNTKKMEALIMSRVDVKFAAKHVIFYDLPNCMNEVKRMMELADQSKLDKVTFFIDRNHNEKDVLIARLMKRVPNLGN